jgi:hypothetical protein
VVLLCSAAAHAWHAPLSARRASPHAPPPLLALRGGAASTYPLPLRYSYESGVARPTQAPPPRVEPTVEEPSDAMSDAERVYVLQQFEKPAIRLAFLRRVYALVSAQLVLTAAVVCARTELERARARRAHARVWLAR